MKKTWICIEVPCASELADDLAAEVAVAFGVGVEITDSGIRFYLEGERLRGEWDDRLRSLLRDFERSAGVGSSLTYSYSPLLDGEWADRWKEGFKPLRVGRRFVVSPTWEQVDAAPGEIVIRIDPGRAFGTGHHETTRLCLEWLEERAASGPDVRSCSMLDVGTGSGILAMGAALLGFARVVGVDTDPEAIEVAEENIRLNDLAEKVQLRQGSVESGERFDVTMANIQANPLIEMAGALAGSLNRSGYLVLSGILVEQKEQVKEAYEAEGLKRVDERTAGEWALLVFRCSSEVR